MRYTRLRRAIEGGTLIGTHGTPFQAGAEKVVEVGKKRKRHLHSTRVEEVDDGAPIATRSGSGILRVEKVEDELADQSDTEESIVDEKIPSIGGKVQALKREVDADERKPISAAKTVHSVQPLRDINRHAKSPRRKVERDHDEDSKNSLTTNRRQPTTNGIREQTGVRVHTLAPRGIQQPVHVFGPLDEKGCILDHKTDDILPTALLP